MPRNMTSELATEPLPITHSSLRCALAREPKAGASERACQSGRAGPGASVPRPHCGARLVEQLPKLGAGLLTGLAEGDDAAAGRR